MIRVGNLNAIYHLESAREFFPSFGEHEEHELMSMQREDVAFVERMAHSKKGDLKEFLKGSFVIK